MQSELELARAAMIAKRFGGNVTGASTGGEGTVRRKKKGAHKSLGGELAALVDAFILDNDCVRSPIIYTSKNFPYHLNY